MKVLAIIILAAAAVAQATTGDGIDRQCDDFSCGWLVSSLICTYPFLILNFLLMLFFTDDGVYGMRLDSLWMR